MARRSQSQATTGHTILVVDDQEETLASVRNLLEREGHHVLTAGSGDQALRLFKEHEIQLLLVEYSMPRMTGEQLIREVRSFDPFVQIILQTGYSGEKPPRLMLAELDIQGYHDKTEGPEKLLLWIEVGLKASRLAKRLQERDRLQRELVANVSHEFRTPLNVIAGYTDLLLTEGFGALPADVVAVLRRVEMAAVNLYELVEDFLKYAKIEAGIKTVTETEIKTQDLVDELQRFAALLTDEKDLVFSIDTQHAPPMFIADGVKVRTILRNFLTNAVKFTRQGRITVRIALEDSGLRFAVQDTGPGIPAEDLDVIFEPFRQLNGSTARRYGGIGLGLALCRKLASLVGGNIEVSSQLDVGSTFTLVLAASAADEQKAAAHAPSCPAAKISPMVNSPADLSA